MKTAVKSIDTSALLPCSFLCRGKRNRGAEHRPVSHKNALCALFRGRTGKHTAGQYFPFFCRCFRKRGKAGVTLLYSLFGESASIAFDWSRNTRALPFAELPCNSLGWAEALHPLTFFEKKVSKETLKQKGASIFEKQENEYTHQRGTPRRHTPQGRASGYDLHRLRDQSLSRQTDHRHRRTG